MTAEPNDAWVEELLRLQDTDSKMTEKQMKILQAAVDIFAEKGYAAASTSEIAQKAGVAEGTIFRHYKTKKELLFSIVGPLIAKFVAPFVLREFTPILDAPYDRYEDFVRAIAKNRLEFARRHLPMLKILLQEIPFHTELREQFKTVVLQEIYARIERVIIHFQKAGQLVPLPPLTIVQLSASALVGFLISRFLIFPEQEWDEEQSLESVVQFIMYGLTPRSHTP